MFRKIRARLREARQRRAYDRHRQYALYRASLGERLPRREREEYNLPDWTG